MPEKLEGKSQSRRYENAIKVADVQAEYRRVALTPCTKCGSRLSVRKQTLLTDEKTTKHYDMLETACAQCGTPREFLFDINSFFGKRNLGDEDAPSKPKRKPRALLFGIFASALMLGLAWVVRDRVNLTYATVFCILILSYFAFEEYRLRRK